MPISKNDIPAEVKSLLGKLGLSVSDMDAFYQAIESDPIVFQSMLSFSILAISIAPGTSRESAITASLISAALYGYSLGLKAEKREGD